MLHALHQEAQKSGATVEELESLAVAPWRFHDLRRTLATGCQRIGVPLEVSEAILNHTSGTRSGIAGVYHVYRFADERQGLSSSHPRPGRHSEEIIVKAP